MKLQNNFTDVKQSKRLLELGVPIDSADCYRARCLFLFKKRGYGQPYILQEDVYSKFVKSAVDSIDFIPCWSVGRLIEILTITYYKPIDWLSFCNEQPIIETILAELEAGITQSLLNFSKLDDKL